MFVVLTSGATMPVAPAASTTVDVMSSLYSPETTHVDPGEPVQFQWLHGGHSVTALNGSFDSGVRGAGATMVITFDGGSLAFRCTLHSTIDASGQCNGMCGEVTEATRDFAPPRASVTEPADGRLVVGRRGVGSVLAAVSFRGSATDDRIVANVRLRLRRPPTTAWQEHSTFCQGCGTASAYWNASVALLAGRYEAQVIASDASANVGRSATITFVVL